MKIKNRTLFFLKGKVASFRIYSKKIFLHKWQQSRNNITA
nr:MAG TPA: hypothetical protein [Caudoviricetes sp.]